MTKEEKHLWYDYLRRCPFQFNRQKVIGRYIVDFYCSEKNVCVELDGSQHYSERGLKRDIERDEYLNSLGISVLRYSNYEVNTNFDGVCNDIYNRLTGRTTDPQLLPGRGEREGE